MAKNTNTAKSDAASGKSWYERKKELSDAVKAEFGDLVYHNVTIKGAKKFEDGTKGECLAVGASKWIQPFAMIALPDGETVFVQPRFVVKGKPIDAKRKALLEAEREAKASETVMLPASIGKESEKAVQLRYKGWFKPMWFSKENVQHLGDTAEEGIAVYEVSTWKIKQEMGEDALEALVAKQGEFAKLMVDKKKGK